MSNHKIKKLLSFWLCDKSNEVLLGDLLYTISTEHDYSSFESIYSNVQYENISLTSIHAQSVELLIRTNKLFLANQHLASYQETLGDWGLYLHALINYTESDFDSCIKHFNDLPKDSIILSKTYVLCARAYYMLGDIETAKTILELYLSTQPNSEALGLYAMCWLDLGEYEKSEQFASHALQGSNYQLDALIALVSCAVAKHDIEMAQKYIGLCLELNPSIGRSWSLAGQIDLYNAHYESAAMAFEKAVELMPEYIGTRHLLAWTYLILDKVAEAAIQFQIALNLNTRFADSHAGLAIIAINNGELEEAKQLVKKSLKLDSISFTANYANSLLLAHAGDENASKEILKRILTSKNELTGMKYTQLIEHALKKYSKKNELDNEY